MNALLDKIFFRLYVIYNNLLKSSKTLKEIKIYFIRINNCYKMTRKTRKKEKIQKINRTIRFHISKKFISFFSRSTYTSQLFVFSYCIIDYCKQKNVDENVCFNCYEQNYVATNYSKLKKRIV